MIKTLRITSVVAAILAGVFFVFPVIYGVRSHENIDEFLKSPGVIEKFENASGKAKTSESRVSPLVEQAKAFALYLNPPKATERKVSKGIKPGNISSRLSVTPKFKVFATSYCPENPKVSQALIDEPGKGRHWVLQSGKVGHLLIEEVKDGVIIVKGGKETFELLIEEKQETTPAKGVSSRSVTRTTSRAPSRVSTGPLRITRRPTQPVRSADEGEKMEELVDKLKDLKNNSTSDKTDSGLGDEERAARIQELINKFRSTRVGAEEAKKLGNVSGQSKGVQNDPNRSRPIVNKAKEQASKPKSK
ncbi:MAG TPA: hypothetical protein DIU00_13905 [Phycisphaerales bacterium]|nr:hypothetical protein [Phycisphaerales bacterium]